MRAADAWPAPGAGRRVARSLVALLALAASAALAAQADGVRFEQCWYRQPLPAVSVTAAYCRIVNSAPTEAAVVAFEPAMPAAAGVRVEMHETRSETNAQGHQMLRMRPLERLLLPPGAARELAPGGAHLMLFGAGSGGDLLLKAVFADGSTTQVRFMERPPDGRPAAARGRGGGLSAASRRV